MFAWVTTDAQQTTQFSLYSPPLEMLYLMPKSPLGPPGLWLAVRIMPPTAFILRITQETAGVDMMPFWPITRWPICRGEHKYTGLHGTMHTSMCIGPKKERLNSSNATKKCDSLLCLNIWTEVPLSAQLERFLHCFISPHQLLVEKLKNVSHVCATSAAWHEWWTLH